MARRMQDMTDEELLAEYNSAKKQSGGFNLGGALTGASQGLAGKSYTGGSGSELVQLLQEEQLKNKINPSRVQAQRELDVAAERRAQQNVPPAEPVVRPEVVQPPVVDETIAQTETPVIQPGQEPVLPEQGAMVSKPEPPVVTPGLTGKPQAEVTTPGLTGKPSPVAAKADDFARIPQTAPGIEPPMHLDVMKWHSDAGGDYRRPTTVVNPKYTKWLEQQDTLSDGQQKILQKGLDERATNMRSYNSISALMQNTVAVWKAAAREKRHFPTIGKSHLPEKMAAGFAEATAWEGLPWTKGYQGQRIEVAMALSKIITGGSRIIKSVIQELMKTLPVDDGIDKDMAVKVYQSLTNSYKRALGRVPDEEEMARIAKTTGEIILSPAAELPEGVETGLAMQSMMPTKKVFMVDGIRYALPPEKVWEFIQDMPEDAVIEDITGTTQ